MDNYFGYYGNINKKFIILEWFTNWEEAQHWLSLQSEIGHAISHRDYFPCHQPYVVVKVINGK